MIKRRTTIKVTVATLFVIVLAVSSLSIASKRGDLVKLADEPNSPDISQCIFPTDKNGSEPNDLTRTYLDPNLPDFPPHSSKILLLYKSDNEPNIPDE